jgi:hypothetical protein
MLFIMEILSGAVEHITRARKSCVLPDSPCAISMAVCNNKVTQRWNGDWESNKGIHAELVENQRFPHPY